MKYDSTYLEVIYRSIHSHTLSAMLSFERKQGVLNKYSKDLMCNDAQMFLMNELNNIVHHAGCISRYFFPANKKYKARGEFLQKHYAVREDDALNERGLRNAIEHFDERFDKYHSDMADGKYLLDVHLMKSMIPTGYKILRGYVVDTHEYYILDESFKIQPLSLSLADINVKTTEFRGI